MQIVKPWYNIMSDISYKGIFELMDIEEAGRVAYRSEDKIKAGFARPFIEKLIRNNHESVLEHSKLTVKFNCDRAIANELVRHRMASFTQESTRYCDYSGSKFGDIQVILPYYIRPGSPEYGYWMSSVRAAEGSYMALRNIGVSPQEARCVLPLCTATRIVVTANYREWRHILKLRTAKSAHPQMRELMIPLLKDLKEQIPVIFDDINPEEEAAKDPEYKDVDIQEPLDTEKELEEKEHGSIDFSMRIEAPSDIYSRLLEDLNKSLEKWQQSVSDMVGMLEDEKPEPSEQMDYQYLRSTLLKFNDNLRKYGPSNEQTKQLHQENQKDSQK